MIIGLIRWIAVCATTVLFAVLAVINRSSVPFFWSPLHESIPVPLYLIFLFAAAFGFGFGALMVWMNTGHLREAKRQQKKEIKALQQEVEKLHKPASAKAPATELFTALPAKLLKP